MKEKKTRSEELLNKTLTYLESIDISTFSMAEIKEFLEVLQQCRFLETYQPVQFPCYIPQPSCGAYPDKSCPDEDAVE